MTSIYELHMREILSSYTKFKGTYDFTETALNSLVRVLYGELTPSGTLPGTISKSQKLHPSKQHWLVESKSWLYELHVRHILTWYLHMCSLQRRARRKRSGYVSRSCR